MYHVDFTGLKNSISGCSTMVIIDGVSVGCLTSSWMWLYHRYHGSVYKPGQHAVWTVKTYQLLGSLYIWSVFCKRF